MQLQVSVTAGAGATAGAGIATAACLLFPLRIFQVSYIWHAIMCKIFPIQCETHLTDFSNYMCTNCRSF